LRSFWSALNGQRLGWSRPLQPRQLNFIHDERGVKPPLTKAATGRHTAKITLPFLPFFLLTAQPQL
jgi:hypothetical protein